MLDIGCWDGYFSFELARRGARVVAVDYQNVEDTGFAIAAEILGSACEYVTDNVYNMHPAAYGHFDLVLFLGVLSI